jgi:hypothetical protein
MFSATISALCYSILDELESASGPIDYARRNNVVRFALQQHARMPDFLRAPVIAVTLLFSLHGFFKTGVPYHRHSPALRRVHLLSWKVSRLGFKRDFVLLFESLSTFAWFSYAD